MKIISLALLMSAGLAAQSGQVVYTGPSAIDGFLKAYPNATVTKVEQSGVTVKVGTQYTFIAGPYLTYQDGTQWKVAQPQIAALSANAGWLQTGGPARVEIAMVSTTPHLKVTSGSSVFDLDVTGISYVSGNEFTFPSSGQNWTLRFLPQGAELQTNVTARQGAKTYSFRASPPVAAAADANGDLTTGSGLITSHAVMLGANHQAYPCSAWAAGNGTLSFTCDDSKLPDAAIPYTIDPLTTLNPSSVTCAGMNDGTTCRLWNSETFAANYTVSLPTGSKVVSGSFSSSYSDNMSCSTTAGFTGPWQGTVSPANMNWASLSSGEAITYSLTVYDNGDECMASIGDDPQIAITYLAPPSGSVSLLPASPTAGSWATINIGVQDPDTWMNLVGVPQQIIINTSRTDSGGCNLTLVGSGTTGNGAGSATLLNDSGGSIGTDVWNFAGVGNSGGTYTSTACSIQLSGGSANGYSTSYSFVVPVNFTIGGTLNVYGNFSDGSGVSTGWITLGTVTITKYTVATPTFSPAPGTYTGAQTVTISTSTPGATIRYTTDGTAPTETHGSVGSGPVQISTTGTIKAMAYLTGWYDSAVGTGTYTITGTVATPTASPAAGTYNTPQTITLTTSTPGATIRYTTDGSTPTETHGTIYTGGFVLTGNVNLKAIGYESSWNDSSVLSAAYTIYAGTVAAPTFNPPGGTYSTAQTVTISTTTSGATIRYTIDGSAPTETHGTIYAGRLTVSTTTSISAVAYESGWLDSAVSGATYTYGQVTPPSSGGGVTTGTPPADSGNGLDPRRTGVRALGAYWGAAGEQIDTASGNLNFSIPLVSPQSRCGWGVTLRLSYNSQMWRQDTSGTWLMGQDLGYGLGWRLQIGSLVPIWSGSSTIDHYLFTDATGAEYSLSVNTNGVWTSQEGAYVSYDSNTNRLYSNDGSFWVMGSTSSSGEQDYGTLYPTLIQDSNGNQIVIQYATGAGGTSANTSARITQISDPRSGTCCTYSTYGFSYNSDAIPHLVGVTNSIGTSESYTFSYAPSQPLNSPFSGASYGTTTLLTGATVGGLNISHTFQYGATSGEMTLYTTPLGGTLGWQYRTFTYNGGISLREVQYRTMQSAPGVTNTWSLSHPDSYDASLTYHAYTDIYDFGANTQKVYWPAVVISATAVVGPIEYQEQNGSGTALYDKTFGWTTDSAGNAYVSAVTTTLDPSTANAIQTTTAQTLDSYGNLIQQQVEDYGSNSVTRAYSFTYLADPNYTTRYIRNRLTQATVTPLPSSITSLASYAYDTGTLQDPGTVYFHDSSYGTNFTYRGNPTVKTVMGSTNYYSYQTTGVVYGGTVNGVSVATSPDSGTGFSLPGVITPNGQSNLATTITYASSWAVASVSGPNGSTSTTNYDIYGRPFNSTSPDGAVTNFTYTYYPSNPNTQKATLNNQWTKTTLDGFGRVISVQTGYDSTVVSEVDTQYGPCACSPLGKMSATSLAYAPGQSVVWTTYTYDSSGRTLTLTQGDGSVTSDAYAGNTKTETDAAGKWKKFTTDAFGNLTIVTEPDPNSQTGGTLLTYYTYNTANQLIQVSMPRNGQGQTRTFTWLGTDLISATNPENGTVSYQYDNAHHVTLRTDAKGQQTQYSYDGDGRLTQTRHYAVQNSQLVQVDQIDYQYDQPKSSFGSNTSGRLAAVSWGGPSYTTPTMSYEYNYNQAGRTTGKRMAFPIDSRNLAIGTQNLDAIYAWDNQGRMTSMTTPDGATYQYQYDAMSNLSGMTQQSCQSYNEDGSCASYAYPSVGSASYNWAGLRTSLSYLGFTETRTYNNLLQLTRLQNSGLDAEYLYQAGQNNGRIGQSVDHVLSETVNYTYDALNRLLSAEETSGKWGNAFSYDGWGNMNGQTWTPGYAATPGTVSQGQTDANGNLLGPPTRPFVYDVENRLVSPASIPSGSSCDCYSWGYDPSGKRVSQNYGGSYPTINQYFFYGIDGKRLTTYWIQANEDGTYSKRASGTSVYFGGTLIQSNGVTVATDRLGLVRANANGEQMAYYPYGLERVLPPNSTTTPDGREKFATYFRDGVINGVEEDYADQRYYNSNAGSFWSPDPAGAGAADPTDPGSWNMYTYAGNDPINFNDPTGLVTCGDLDVQGGGTLSDAVLHSGSSSLLTQFVWAEGGTLSQNGNSESTLNYAQEIIALAVLNRLAIANGQVAVLGANGTVYWGAGGGGTSSVSSLGYGTLGTTLGQEIWRAAGGAIDNQSGLPEVPNSRGRLNSSLQSTLNGVLGTDLGDPTQNAPGRVPVVMLDGSTDYVTPECEAVISAWQATSTVLSGGVTNGRSLITSWKSLGGSNPDPGNLTNVGSVGGTTFFGFLGYQYAPYPYTPSQRRRRPRPL